MLNSGASTTELEAMHDDFDLYCDLYNGSKQVAADVMWVVKDVWWWSDIVSQLRSKGGLIANSLLSDSPWRMGSIRVLAA